MRLLLSLLIAGLTILVSGIGFAICELFLPCGEEERRIPPHIRQRGDHDA